MIKKGDKVPVYELIWVGVDGYQCQTIPGLRYFAIPCNGRKNSHMWQITTYQDREPVCQLLKKEVRPWLIAVARRDNVSHNSTWTAC